MMSFNTNIKCILALAGLIAVTGISTISEFSPISDIVIGQAFAQNQSDNVVLNLNIPTKGNPNAKVTIVEFSDYQCPFCSRVEPTIAQILEAYPNNVRVAFVNNPLPFHSNAMPASKAAIAAMNQGKFWEMHEALFANQKNLTEYFFKEKASELGLDVAKFEADMNAPETENFINKGIADGKSFGISGTPSFLINGVFIVGAQPLDAFKTIIDEQLKRADDVAKAKNLSGLELYQELVKTAPKNNKDVENDDTPKRYYIEDGKSPILGNKNALITIIEYTDFQCPFCARANTTIHQLLENNPNQIKLVFKHNPLPFHANAKLAHQAAEAAKKQGKFWEYRDILFEHQDALDRDSLIAYAEQLGLKKKNFIADMDSSAVIKAVEDDLKTGSKANIKGTPSFFINGFAISGAQSLEKFQDTVNNELEFAKAYPKLKGSKLYKKIVEDNPNPSDIRRNIDINGAPFKGSDKAKVTLVVFSDFQCPFCSRLNPTLDALLQAPAYKDKIKVIFKQLPLAFHTNAQKAAEASLFAHEHGKFWEMHEKLFANQQALDLESLKKYATEIGLDANALEAALNSGKYKAAVDADAAAGKNAGITGTPTTVINGKIIQGAQPLENFKHEIDEALADANTKKKK